MSPSRRRLAFRALPLLAVVSVAAAGAARADGGAVASGPATVGVLPLEDLTDATPDLVAFRAQLNESLVARGVATVRPEVIDDGLARRRIRFTGGMDEETALWMREVAGVGAFLATSCEAYDPGENPRLALTARLMWIESDRVRPVWAQSYHYAGDDHPGALGRQLVQDIRVLEARAIEAIAADLANWMNVRQIPDAGKDDAQRRFRPRSLFVAQGSTPVGSAPRKIVVLPFRNQSLNPHAGEILALEIAHQLVREGRFEVVERGVVRKALLDLRIIQEGGISLAQADLLRALLDADLVVSGTVSDWRDGYPGTPALVDFSAYAVDTRAKIAAWLARARGEGDQGVYFFGLREVRTAPALGRELVRGLLKEIASRTRKESRAPSP